MKRPVSCFFVIPQGFLAVKLRRYPRLLVPS